MIVYVLFVHKRSVSKRKVCIIFKKNLNLKKPKKTFLVGCLIVFLGGFFGWVFYCQPCPSAVSTVQAAAAVRGRAGGEFGRAQAERGRGPAAAAEPRHQAATEAGDHLHPRASRVGQPAA